MKVLCAVDGSEFSEWAVDAIGTLFHHSLKEVVILHVIDSLPFQKGLKKEGAASGRIKKVLGAIEAEAKKVLKGFEERAEITIGQAATKPFVVIKPVLAHGHVADTIVKQAEKRKPDVIMLGSRGLSDIKGYLMGSVSRKVLSYAPCAVLTVKEPVPEMIRVVLAVDGSPASKRAVSGLMAWGTPETVSIHIMSVVPHILTDIAPRVLPKAHMKALTEPLQKRAEEFTAQFRELFLKEGYQVTNEILEGNLRQVILNCLEKKKADLAVLGSKGLTGPERFQMGSVSEWVAAYAPCSVLVFRPKPH